MRSMIMLILAGLMVGGAAAADQQAKVDRAKAALFASVSEGYVVRNGSRITGFVTARTATRNSSPTYQLYPCGGGDPIPVTLSEVHGTQELCAFNKDLPTTASIQPLRRLRMLERALDQLTPIRT